jgi:hypothetical protein
LNAKLLAGVAAVAVIGVTLIVAVKKEPQPLVIDLPTPIIVPPAPYVEPPAYVEPPQPKTISTVPRQCLPYKRRIINESRNWWGLDGYPATFAAQIEQESACKPDAVSRVGAQGLAQFMPATAEWFSQEYMGVPPEPLNPGWAIRGLVQYDKYLWDRVKAVDTCNRMAKSLSSYNGGLKWITRDEKLAADPMVWFGSVDRVNSGRSAANWKENRDYPKRILQKLEPRYVESGYGQGACHE